MRRVIVPEVWRLLMWCLVALGIGAIAGYPLLALLLALLANLAFQFVSAFRFLRWIDRGQVGLPPPAYGLWKVLGEYLYRSRQRQMRSTRNIRKVFHRISQLTHAIDEGIVILDRDFRLEWWNNSAAAFLGLSSRDRSIPLINLIRNPRFIEYLKQHEFDSVLELPARQNPGLWISFAAYRFGEGEIVLVITDITRLKKAELMRKDFVGNVSHELRTPLTVLRGYLETLVDSKLIESPRVLKAFDQMRDQAMRMQAMADDLIALSRLDSHPDAPDRAVEPVELKPLFEKMIEEAKVVSEGRHHFVLDCDPSLTVLAEPEDLHSALGNLVINAVRHNPADTQITVKAEKDKHYLNIHITDNGVGISAEVIPRLTERFYRVDSSRNSTNGGTGLGLAIVKHIVNRHGGQLLITSKLGEGSDFHCQFPLK